MRLSLMLAAVLCLGPALARAQDQDPDAAGGGDAPSTDLPTTDNGASGAIGASRGSDAGISGGLHAPTAAPARKAPRAASSDGDDGGGGGGGGFASSGGGWTAPHEESQGSCSRVTMNPPIYKQPKFHFAQAVIENSPADVANYAQTTQITRLDITKDGFRVDFTKKDGEGRWPDITTPGWGGPLQYSLWMVESVGSRWYASGPIEYWYGLERSGGAPSQVASNWFYAADRWGPMACHQPRVGERVGFLVTHGDARNNGNGSRPLRERSDIVWIQYPSDAGGVYSF